VFLRYASAVKWLGIASDDSPQFREATLSFYIDSEIEQAPNDIGTIEEETVVYYIGLW
jgi:hypothetical protein